MFFADNVAGGSETTINWNTSTDLFNGCKRSAFAPFSSEGDVANSFPIREYGVNYEAQPLQPHEIEAMKADPATTARLIKSYNMMLDFYGMRLISEETGLLDRVPPPRNFEARYRNLVRECRPFSYDCAQTSPFDLGHSHNNLRISRILKCLSELGLERLNAGFLLHVLGEQSEEDELNTPMLQSSMDRWWANCIRCVVMIRPAVLQPNPHSSNSAERQWITEHIRKVRSGKGSFTRDMYKEALERRKATGSFS